MRYETLRKIAIYGAVASISGSFVLHHFTQVSANLASGDYYRLTLDAVKTHQKTNDILGSPLKFAYMNLARKDIRISADKAQIVVPIRGSKRKGNVYSTSYKMNERWYLQDVEVEIKQNDQTSRITIVSTEGDSKDV